MIGDHHGRTAGRATLLVTAVDEILGTRRLEAAEDALADALAAMKSAEGAFDAADDRFATAERALDEAREERAQAHRQEQRRQTLIQARTAGFASPDPGS